MKNLFLLIFLIGAFNCQAQLSPSFQFIGEWNCTDTKFGDLGEFAGANAEIMQGLEIMRDAFLQSKLTFRADGSFKYEMGLDKSSVMAKETGAMLSRNNTKWKLEKEKRRLLIGTPEDGYSIMAFNMKEESGYMVFHLDESPILLKLERIK